MSDVIGVRIIVIWEIKWNYEFCKNMGTFYNSESCNYGNSSMPWMHHYYTAMDTNEIS